MRQDTHVSFCERSPYIAFLRRGPSCRPEALVSSGHRMPHSSFRARTALLGGRKHKHAGCRHSTPRIWAVRALKWGCLCSGGRVGPAACCREVHRVYMHGSAAVAVKVAQKVACCPATSRPLPSSERGSGGIYLAWSPFVQLSQACLSCLLHSRIPLRTEFAQSLWSRIYSYWQIAQR